jgi:hypothetical protein
MRGKGRIEFGGITDDFFDISLTNITTVIKMEEKEKKETNEYRTYKIRKGPACYVPYKLPMCSTYKRIWKAKRTEL